MRKIHFILIVCASIFLIAGILIEHYWLAPYRAESKGEIIDPSISQNHDSGLRPIVGTTTRANPTNSSAWEEILGEQAGAIAKWKKIISVVDTIEGSQIGLFVAQLKEAVIQGKFPAKDLSFVLRMLGERATASEAISLLDDDFWHKGQSAALGDFLQSWATKQPEVALQTMKSRGNGEITEAGLPLLGFLQGLWKGSPSLIEAEIDGMAPKVREHAMLARALVLADGKDYVAGVSVLGQISNAKEGDALEYTYPAFRSVVLEAGPEAMQRVGDELYRLGGGIPDVQSINLSSWSSAMAKKYPEEALQWATNLDPGPARGLALNGVLLQLTLQDPNRALNYLENFQASLDEQINAVAAVESGLGQIPNVDPELVEQCKQLIRNLEKQQAQTK